VIIDFKEEKERGRVMVTTNVTF